MKIDPDVYPAKAVTLADLATQPWFIATVRKIHRDAAYELTVNVATTADTIVDSVVRRVLTQLGIPEEFDLAVNLHARNFLRGEIARHDREQGRRGNNALESASLSVRETETVQADLWRDIRDGHVYAYMHGDRPDRKQKHLQIMIRDVPITKASQLYMVAQFRRECE